MPEEDDCKPDETRAMESEMLVWLQGFGSSCTHMLLGSSVSSTGCDVAEIEAFSRFYNCALVRIADRRFLSNAIELYLRLWVSPLLSRRDLIFCICWFVSSIEEQA